MVVPGLTELPACGGRQILIHDDNLEGKVHSRGEKQDVMGAHCGKSGQTS